MIGGAVGGSLVAVALVAVVIVIVAKQKNKKGNEEEKTKAVETSELDTMVTNRRISLMFGENSNQLRFYSWTKVR